MRIISAAPSNTEILYALGLEDCVVGTTSLCDYPEEVRRKPSIGGWSQGVRYQRIDELKPDIILMSDSLQDEQASRLRESYEVLQVSPESLEEVFKSIEKIGERFNRENKASEIVKQMKNGLEEVELAGSRIYCEEWMDPPMVSGNWIPYLIRRGGGDYFIEDGRSRKFSVEKLKEFDPEYIFLNVCGAETRVNKEEVMNRSRWEELSAVKQNNVEVIDDALLNRPGPRIVEGLKEIEEFISRNQVS